MHQLTLRIPDSIADRIAAVEASTPLTAAQVVRISTELGLEAIELDPSVLWRPLAPPE